MKELLLSKFEHYREMAKMWGTEGKDTDEYLHSYLQFMFAKMNYHKDLFNGSMQIDIAAPSADSYFAMVKNILKERLLERSGGEYNRYKSYKRYNILDPLLASWLDAEIEVAKAKLAEITKNIDDITIDELKSNELLNTRNVEGRRYDKGMRVSKFLGRIGFEERDYASVKFDYENTNNDIVLSLDPGDILHGGVIGNSCYSPDGSNNHATVATFRYAQGLIAYSNDGNPWRAWVYVDQPRKLVFIAASHPYEDQIKQQAVYDFFVSKGYMIADDIDTSISVYLDSGYSKIKELYRDHVNPNSCITLKDISTIDNSVDFKFSGRAGTCGSCDNYVLFNGNDDVINHDCEGSDHDDEEEE